MVAWSKSVPLVVVFLFLIGLLLSTGRPFREANPLPFGNSNAKLGNGYVSTLFYNWLPIVDRQTIDLVKLGHRVRFLRQGKQWALTDLAARSGVSKAYISDLENGVAGKPNIQYVFAVAQALDTTLDDLLHESSSQLQSQPSKGRKDLPPGLRELQQEIGLSEDDVERLATVNFRGHRPKDKEGWRFLLETLQMLSQRKPQR
jgi:transcriptional regulator with XRE-family HTH domain